MVKKTRDTEQMSLAGTEEGEILAKLNDRIEKAIATIQELRRERDTMKTRLEQAERRLSDQGEATERLNTLEQDYDRFKAERSEIRNRIETMLATLETLDAAGDEA